MLHCLKASSKWYWERHANTIWLARTLYKEETGFVFPSWKKGGRVPLTSCAFVADHLRTAAMRGRSADRRRPAVRASQPSSLDTRITCSRTPVLYHICAGRTAAEDWLQTFLTSSVGPGLNSIEP